MIIKSSCSFISKGGHRGLNSHVVGKGKGPGIITACAHGNSEWLACPPGALLRHWLHRRREKRSELKLFVGQCLCCLRHVLNTPFWGTQSILGVASTLVSKLHGSSSSTCKYSRRGSRRVNGSYGQEKTNAAASCTCSPVVMIQDYVFDLGRFRRPSPRLHFSSKTATMWMCCHFFVKTILEVLIDSIECIQLSPAAMSVLSLSIMRV